LHHQLGGDPHWALYHQRERLAFTDPPAPAPPQPHHHGGRRSMLAVLAIIAVLRADTTPIATTGATNLGGHSAISATRTSSAPQHGVATTWRVHRHAPLVHPHTKETLA
jgi:hypothetical protein